jgi:Tfp pilus assembly protein FimT
MRRLVPRLNLAESGYTVVELVATFGIFAVLASIALPSLSETKGQLAASQDARLFSGKITGWRSEAVRLRRPIVVSFEAKSGSSPAKVNADIDGNSVIEDSLSLSTNSNWVVEPASPSPMPSNFTIDAMGLTRSLAADGTTFTIQNGESDITLTIFKSGLTSFK